MMPTPSDRRDHEDTTPSASSTGLMSDATPASGNRSPTIRPGILASVGRLFSSNKKEDISSSVLDQEGRLTTPPVGAPSLTKDYITPVEKRYLRVASSDSLKVLRMVLSACYLSKEQIELMVTRGRIHTLRKLFSLSESDWDLLKDTVDDLTDSDFKHVVMFQLWYDDPSNDDVRGDEQVLLDKLNQGSLDEYRRALERSQVDIEVALEKLTELGPSQDDIDSSFTKVRGTGKKSRSGSLLSQTSNGDDGFVSAEEDVSSLVQRNPLEGNSFAPLSDDEDEAVIPKDQLTTTYKSALLQASQTNVKSEDKSSSRVILSSVKPTTLQHTIPSSFTKQETVQANQVTFSPAPPQSKNDDGPSDSSTDESDSVSSSDSSSNESSSDSSSSGWSSDSSESSDSDSDSDSSTSSKKKKKKKKKRSKKQKMKHRRIMKKHDRRSYTNAFAKRTPSLFDDVKFPSTPVSAAKLEQFKSVFALKMEHTQCERYILDNVADRRIQPSKSDRPTRYRRWKKDVTWIGVALKTCLINHSEGFALIKDERDGVKAWDILMNRYDRRVFNEGSSRAGDLNSLLKITLESTSLGSFNKFISKFEKTATFVKVNDDPLPDEFKQDLLTRAIQNKSYGVFLTTAKTRSPPYTYSEFVYALQVYASEIEGKGPSTDSHDNRTIKYAKKINGYAVNEYGIVEKKSDWDGMTSDQRAAYYTSKDKLLGEGKLKKGKPVFPSAYNDDKSSSQTNPGVGQGKSKSARNRRNLKAKLQKLEASVGNGDNDTSTSPSPTPPAQDSSPTDSFDFSNVSSAQRKMITQLINSSGGRKVNQVRTRTINFNAATTIRLHTDDHIYRVTVDGGADTCLDGRGHIFLEYTERLANVVGFDDDVTKQNLHIGTSITVVTTSSGDDILLLKNESIDHTSQANSMLSVNQVRAHGIDLDDCPSRFKVDGRKGRQSMIVDDDGDHEPWEIPFDFDNNLISYNVREPTSEEVDTLPMVMITSDQQWDPQEHTDDGVIHHISSEFEGRWIVNNDLHDRVLQRLSSTPSCKSTLKCHNGDSIDLELQSQILNLVAMSKSDELSNSHEDSLSSTMFQELELLPAHCFEIKSKRKPIELEKLKRNMLIRDDVTARKTIESTTQLGKHIVRYPQRAHLRSRYPQLNVTRLHERFSTDTMFSKIQALGGETCAQCYLGLTSKVLEAYGMALESEGPGSLLRFIRERGAMAGLKNDNSKMQTSKKWNSILDQYSIAAETTEPYHPQQNQVERKIQTMKNMVMSILDATSAPSSLWLYCLYYVIDVLNSTERKELDWRTPIEVAYGFTPDIFPLL